ncbi:MAG: hypothetical protein WDN00_08125 [Limisphaerales bacterium]
MELKFLNVDLEIWSASKMDFVAAEINGRVSILHCGPAPKRHLLAIQILPHCKNPDLAIHALCAVIEKLTPKSRRIWNAAKKEFDVGFEIKCSKQSSRFSLRPDTLTRIASLGASLAVTYYKIRLEFF